MTSRWYQAVVVVVVPLGGATAEGGAGPAACAVAVCWNCIVTSWPGVAAAPAGTGTGAAGSLLNANTRHHHHIDNYTALLYTS